MSSYNIIDSIISPLCRHYLLPVSAFGDGAKIVEMGVMCSSSNSDKPTVEYVVRLGEFKVSHYTIDILTGNVSLCGG